MVSTEWFMIFRPVQVYLMEVCQPYKFANYKLLRNYEVVGSCSGGLVGLG